MAIEPKRGCGYRKVGGLYLVGGKLGAPCGKLPLELDVCPTCHAGVKPTRGWTWVEPGPLFGARTCDLGAVKCFGCPLGQPDRIGRVGLLWVGERFYPTPAHFLHEGATLGVSRRLTAVPKDLKIGETWVLLAHRKVDFRDGGEPRPGVFSIFLPLRIERVVTESQSRDREEMERLSRRGITPFVVPDDDPDHVGDHRPFSFATPADGVSAQTRLF